MNTADAAPLAQQAARHTAAGWSWCFLHPSQVAELAQAVQERDEARGRLAQIAALVPSALQAWAEHDREAERVAWAEVERLSSQT